MAINCGPVTGYYDGDCVFCEKSITVFIRLCRLEESFFKAHPAQSNAAIWAEMQRINRWIVVTPEGNQASGFEAVLITLGLSPRFKRLVPLFRLPVLYGLGDWAYDFVANHRPFFSKLFSPWLSLHSKG